jgi:hypothetical protein
MTVRLEKPAGGGFWGAENRSNYRRVLITLSLPPYPHLVARHGMATRAASARRHASRLRTAWRNSGRSPAIARSSRWTESKSLLGERKTPPHPGVCHGRGRESQQARPNLQ